MTPTNTTLRLTHFLGQAIILALHQIRVLLLIRQSPQDPKPRHVSPHDVSRRLQLTPKVRAKGVQNQHHAAGRNDPRLLAASVPGPDRRRLNINININGGVWSAREVLEETPCRGICMDDVQEFLCSPPSTTIRHSALYFSIAHQARKRAPAPWCGRNEEGRVAIRFKPQPQEPLARCTARWLFLVLLCEATG